MTKKPFKPTKDMIAAAESVFLAMAFVETIRPIVVGYQAAILKKHQFPVAKQFKDMGEIEDVVLNPDHAYLMDLKTDMPKFIKECRVEQKKAGLKTDSPEKCPLLVAESLLRNAKHVLIETMEPVTGLKASVLIYPHYDEYVELTLRLLAPFVNHESALKRAA